LCSFAQAVEDEPIVADGVEQVQGSDITTHVDAEGSDDENVDDASDSDDDVDFANIDEGDEGDEGDDEEEEEGEAKPKLSIKDLMGPTLSDDDASDYENAGVDEEDEEIDEDEDEETGVVADNVEIVHNSKKARK